MEIQNFKMRVTPEESRIVQQTLFNNGCQWTSFSKVVGNIDKPFLHLKNKIITFNELVFEDFYINNELPELTFQEFFDTYVKWCIRGSKELALWQLEDMHDKCDCLLKEDNTYYKPISGLLFWRPYNNLPEDYIEITFEQFKKYVLKIKDMEKKIIGYKLLKDLPDRRAGIIFKWDSLEEGGWTSGDEEDDYTYTQEQVDTLTDWFEPVYEESSKELYFGRVKFTIKKSDNFATTEYGKVTKEEIKNAIDYIKNPPILGGYVLNIFYDGNRADFSLLDDVSLISYGFGCQGGKLSELEAIYNTFE